MARSQWHDRKRYLWPLGLLVPMLVFVAMAGLALTGWGIWAWIGPVFVFVLVPVIDLLTGVDESNPPDEAIPALEADPWYRWLTFLYLPMAYLGLAAAMWSIMTWDLPLADRLGLAVTAGFVAAFGIVAGHELGHKRDDVERWLGKAALAPSAYGHFYLEHNRGHHVRVATPDDPASSRLGESFYAFLPRTVVGSLRSAWRLERARYALRGKHPWRPGNDVLNAWAFTVVLFAVIVVWLGIGVLPYLVLQAVVGFTLLEVVNYVEHYGLLRQRVGVAGYERYERVEPRHSWNANQIATNVLLYHLQRHSDHHANPTRRYQALRDYPDAPQLPTGYAGMILLAVVPPVWRRVMDPRVVAHYDGDVRLANTGPRPRPRTLARLERRFPPPAPRVTADLVGYGTVIRPSGQLLADAAGVPGAARMACPGCGWVYDEAVGAPREGFPAGTAWSSVPDTWCCPDCGVREKVDFVAVASSPL